MSVPQVPRRAAASRRNTPMSPIDGVPCVALPRRARTPANGVPVVTDSPYVDPTGCETLNDEGAR